jgi:hypothetical protein
METMSTNSSSLFSLESQQTVRESCYLTHIKDDPNCEQTRQSILQNIKYDVLAGSLSIDINASNIPQTITRPLDWRVTLDDKIVDVSTIANDLQWTLSIYGLRKITDSGLSSGSYKIKISFSDESKNLGCDFEIEILYPSINDISFGVDCDVASIAYSPRDVHHELDLDQFTYTWRIDGIINRDMTTKSEDVSDNRLALYTSESDVICTVEIPELGKTFSTGTIVIERNKYEIETKLSNVINGNNLYSNIETIHTAPNNIHVLYFIDGEKLSDTHFNAIENTGKTLSTVLTYNSALQTFDKSDLVSYESYIEQTIPQSSFDDILMRAYNSVDNNVLLNTYNSTRRTAIEAKQIKDHRDTINYKIQSHSTVDEMYYIEAYNNIINDRPGRIYELGDTMYCLDADKTPQIVDITMFNEKRVIMVDKESISLFTDVPTINAYFGLQTSVLKMSQSGDYIEQKDNNDVSISVTRQKRIYQLQINMSFEKQFTNTGAKMLFMFSDTTGSVVSKVGFERLHNGLIRHYKGNGTHADLHQDAFDVMEVVRPTTQHAVKTFTIVMVNSLDDNMRFKDLVLMEEK